MAVLSRALGGVPKLVFVSLDVYASSGTSSTCPRPRVSKACPRLGKATRILLYMHI